MELCADISKLDIPFFLIKPLSRNYVFEVAERNSLTQYK